MNKASSVLIGLATVFASANVAAEAVKPVKKTIKPSDKAVATVSVTPVPNPIKVSASLEGRFDMMSPYERKTFQTLPGGDIEYKEKVTETAYSVGVGLSALGFNFLGKYESKNSKNTATINDSVGIGWGHDGTGTKTITHLNGGYKLGSLTNLHLGATYLDEKENKDLSSLTLNEVSRVSTTESVSGLGGFLMAAAYFGDKIYGGADISVRFIPGKGNYELVKIGSRIPGNGYKTDRDVTDTSIEGGVTLGREDEKNVILRNVGLRGKFGSNTRTAKGKFPDGTPEEVQTKEMIYGAEIVVGKPDSLINFKIGGESHQVEKTGSVSSNYPYSTIYAEIKVTF